MTSTLRAGTLDEATSFCATAQYSLRLGSVIGWPTTTGSGFGKWVAHHSTESGTGEIYVRSIAQPEEHRISTAGGFTPRWRGDGKELFYVTGDAVVAVAVRPDGSFGAPSRLFDRSTFLLNYRFQSYHASPDGKRFLMIRRDAGAVRRQLNVILNWSGDPDRPARSETQ